MKSHSSIGGGLLACVVMTLTACGDQSTVATKPADANPQEKPKQEQATQQNAPAQHGQQGAGEAAKPSDAKPAEQSPALALNTAVDDLEAKIAGGLAGAELKAAVAAVVSSAKTPQVLGVINQTMSGNGRAQNRELGVALAEAEFERSANPRAGLIVADALRTGQGRAKDAAAAMAILQSAKFATDPNGLFRQALIMLDPKNGIGSKDEALALLKQAADAGHAGAAAQLQRLTSQ